MAGESERVEPPVDTVTPRSSDALELHLRGQVTEQVVAGPLVHVGHQFGPGARSCALVQAAGVCLLLVIAR